MSFNEACLLPMAVTTTWTGLRVLGLSRDMAYRAPVDEGVLVWSGSSSLDSGAVQIWKLLGYIVNTAASEKHHEYVKSLGASKELDYRKENVEESIVRVAKEDGGKIRTGFDAFGEVQSCLDVLKEFMGERKLKVATSKPMSNETPKTNHVEFIFMEMQTNEKERNEIFFFVYGVCRRRKLEKGEFKSSPVIQVFDGGLEAAN